MYKIVHGSIWSSQQRTCNQKIDNSAVIRNITANKNCYRFSFSLRTVPEWSNLPDHLRSAHSVETFRAQLAQEIDIAALISRSHYYYDWDDCWPPVPYVPYGSFARNRFRIRSQHLSTEIGDPLAQTLSWTKASCKVGRGISTITTLFYERNTFSFWMTMKTKSIILFDKFWWSLR